MLILAVRGAVRYAPEEEKSACPLLLVAVGGDRRMPPFIAWQLYELSASPEKCLLILPETRRGEAFNRRSEEYGKAVAEFLAQIRARGAPEGSRTTQESSAKEQNAGTKGHRVR